VIDSIFRDHFLRLIGSLSDREYCRCASAKGTGNNVLETWCAPEQGRRAVVHGT
jgi:hypothetical protein